MFAIIFEIGDGVFKSLLLFLIAFLIKKEKYDIADSDTLSVEMTKKIEINT